MKNIKKNGYQIFCNHSIVFYDCYRSPASVIDPQINKNPKVEEGKFETENRRRAEKLLKKQYGLKPVDSWRKHKKAFNAAKYFEELPVAEKINLTSEPKVPIEIKLDPKIVKTAKSNKKVSISLPVIKQNNSELPITVLNSISQEVIKKPIASVAPYQIVLPKQAPIVKIERTIEKSNIKPKPNQPSVQNKTEKELNIIRPVASKKLISEDDGLLAEYKYTKKKNKTERKASLPPTIPPVVLPVVKPKVQNVERFNLPEVTKQKIQNMEKLNVTEVIKPKIQTVEKYNSPELIKSKAQTEERCYSPEEMKPKVQVIEKCNMREVIKRKTNEVVVSTFTGKENNEMSLNKFQIEQQPKMEKKITVLKRDSDEKLSPNITNKHGNFFI